MSFCLFPPATTIDQPWPSLPSSFSSPGAGYLALSNYLKHPKTTRKAAPSSTTKTTSLLDYSNAPQSPSASSPNNFSQIPWEPTPCLLSSNTSTSSYDKCHRAMHWTQLHITNHPTTIWWVSSTPSLSRISSPRPTSCLQCFQSTYTNHYLPLNLPLTYSIHKATTRSALPHSYDTTIEQNTTSTTKRPYG